MSLVPYRVRTRWDPNQETLKLCQGPNNSIVNISQFSAVPRYQFIDQTTPVTLQFPLKYSFHIDCAAKYKSQLTVYLVHRHPARPHPTARNWRCICLLPRHHCQSRKGRLGYFFHACPPGYTSSDLNECIDIWVL